MLMIYLFSNKIVFRSNLMCCLLDDWELRKGLYENGNYIMRLKWTKIYISTN